MAAEEGKKLELVYTLFCDDVRLEVGNKLSLMGVFHNIVVQQLPVSLIKFAVVNHWRGSGTHLSEVQNPDARPPAARRRLAAHAVRDRARRLRRQHQLLRQRRPSRSPGQYWVQTLVNSTLFDEQPLAVADAQSSQPTESLSDAVN